MCCTKICLTKKEAESFIKHNYKSKPYRRELRTYYCEEHNAWHTTSKIMIVNQDIELTAKPEWEKLLAV